METKRGPGRPRKHATPAARVAAHREAHKDKGGRVEVFLNDPARWRLDELAKAWGVSRSVAMERLILEADQGKE